MCEKRVFSDIPEVNLLEKREQWYDACALLYKRWKIDEKNMDVILRLLWECWYLDVEDLCFVHFTMEETEKVHRMFQEAYCYGEQFFWNDGKYMWMTGFMLSVCAFLMYDFTRYQEELLTSGIEIPDLADMEAEYRLQHADGIPYEIKMAEQGREKLPATEAKRKKKLFGKKKLTPAEQREKEEIEETIRRVNKRIEEYFPGDSLIDKYFREIYSLNNWLFMEYRMDYLSQKVTSNSDSKGA